MSWKLKKYLLLEDFFIHGQHQHNDGTLHPLIMEGDNCVFCHGCGEIHEFKPEELDEEKISFFWIADYMKGKYERRFKKPLIHVHSNGKSYGCINTKGQIRCTECLGELNSKGQENEELDIIHYEIKNIPAKKEMALLVQKGIEFWFKVSQENEDSYFFIDGFRNEIHAAFLKEDDLIHCNNNIDIIYSEDSLIFELDKYPDEKELFSQKKEEEAEATQINRVITKNFTPTDIKKFDKEKTLVPGSGIAPVIESNRKEPRDTTLTPTIEFGKDGFGDENIIESNEIPSEQQVFQISDDVNDEDFDGRTPLSEGNLNIIVPEEEEELTANEKQSDDNETFVKDLQEEIAKLKQELLESETVDDKEFADNVIAQVSSVIINLIKTEYITAKTVLSSYVDCTFTKEKREKVESFLKLLTKTIKSLKKETQANEAKRLTELTELIEEMKSAEEDRIIARNAELEANAEKRTEEFVLKAKNAVIETANQASYEQITSQQSFDKHLKLKAETLEDSKAKGLKNYDERLNKTAKDLKKSSWNNWFWVIFFVVFLGIIFNALLFFVNFQLYQKAKQKDVVLTEKLKKQEKSFRTLGKAEEDLQTVLKTNLDKATKLLNEFKDSFKKEKVKWLLAEKNRDKIFSNKVKKLKRPKTIKETSWTWYHQIYSEQSQRLENLELKSKALVNKTDTAISRINTVADTVNKLYKSKTVQKKAIKKPKLVKKTNSKSRPRPKYHHKKVSKRNYFETLFVDENGKVTMKKTYYK